MPAETKPADVKPVNTKPPEERPKAVKRIDTMLAVFDLETKGKVDNDISYPLSESIRREVVKSGKYEVIDRGNMNKILGEQKFQLSGCAAGECIVEAGQLLGVGKIITGSVSLVGKTYYLSLSLINVETGKIEDVSEDECKCEVDDLIKSSKRLVKKLLGESVPEPQISVKPELKSREVAEGEYYVSGKNPNGSSYSGSVSISRNGDMFRLVWRISMNVYTGTGQLRGNILTVNWGAADPVIYTVQEDGILAGTWAGGTATEILTPKNIK
ncbi:MAG: hypothetical protein HZA11_00865 [Nitrospirae bacterium]|nr:hypothetical protein [Nitrospirota bacterium]